MHLNREQYITLTHYNHIIFQMFFSLNLKEIRDIHVYVYNHDQIYLPNRLKLYGSSHQTIKLVRTRPKGTFYEFTIDMELSRTLWKTLDRPEKICDDSYSKPNTSRIVNNATLFYSTCNFVPYATLF
jgi:hypothetical protein